MSLRDYLHEKAEESRHNESIGYFIIIIGSIFFVGGSLITASIFGKEVEWIFFPYKLTDNPYSLFGFALNLIGIVLLALGISLCVYYAIERAWYMEELRKAQAEEGEKLLKRKRRKKIKLEK